MATGLEFWALTLDFLGKFMIAVTALLAHRRLIIEKRLDRLVFKDLRLEISVGLVAIALIIAGYILNVYTL